MDTVTETTLSQQQLSDTHPLHTTEWGGSLMRLVIVPVMLMICSLSIMPYDMLVARQMKVDSGPKFFREVIENTEPFGHAIGVVFIGWAIFVLAPSLRRYLPRILCAAIGAGLATNIFKLIIGRTRPRDLTDFSITVSETFTGWFPILSGEKLSQSYPSAHSTVAVAFAVALSAAFPQGRKLFFVMAACVCFDRIQCLAHYPSDVFAGAACGWLFAQLTINGPVANRIFQRYEPKSKPKVHAPATVVAESQQAA